MGDDFLLSQASDPSLSPQKPQINNERKNEKQGETYRSSRDRPFQNRNSPDILIFPPLIPLLSLEIKTSQRFVFDECCFSTCGGDGARLAFAEEGANYFLEYVVDYEGWRGDLGGVGGEKGCGGGDGGRGSEDVT